METGLGSSLSLPSLVRNSEGQRLPRNWRVAGCPVENLSVIVIPHSREAAVGAPGRTQHTELNITLLMQVYNKQN